MRYFPHFQRCLKPDEKGFEVFSLLGEMEKSQQRLQQADHVPCQNSGVFPWVGQRDVHLTEMALGDPWLLLYFRQ